MQLCFRKWYEETAGEDHSRLNSENPGFGRSRYGTPGYPCYPPDKLKDKKKDPLMGFMKKMRKK